MKPRQGKTGYFRFCRRADIDPSSLGYTGVDETPLTRRSPSRDDVIMILKHHMGDDLPYKAVMMCSAEEATSIRLGFRAGNEVAERRLIPANVRKNLESYAPRCLAQGIISADANAYLLSWCEGSLEKKARPVQYSIFNFRQPNVVDVPGVLPLPWQAPMRQRHLQVEPPKARDDGDGANSDVSDDDEVFCMPLGA